MLSLTIKDDIEVLDVEVVDLDAVLSIKTLLEDGSVVVDVVQDVVSVFLLSSGEDDYLIPLGQLFEYILHIRAQAYLNLSVLEIEGECRLKSSWNKAFKLCSNKRLIHVKNDEPIGCLCSKLH